MSRACSRAAALLAAVLLALPASAAAEKYTADFQTKGTGARPLAMGGAFTAVGDDADALFFNPGALAALDGRRLTLMHCERFGGLVQVDHVGFQSAVRIKERPASVGLSVLRVAVDDIKLTDSPEVFGWDPDEDPDGVFGPDDLDALIRDGLLDPALVQTRSESNQNWAFLGVYATRLGGWSVGGGVKVIYQSIDSYSSFGFGLDAGALSPEKWGFRAGLKLQDISGTYVAWSTGVSETLPPSLRPGLAWQRRLPALRASLLVAADAELRFENYREAAVWHAGDFSADPHLGAELWVLDAVALRLGLDGEAWTAGGGLRLTGDGGTLPWHFFRDLSLDYGFGSHEDFDGSHRLGLGLRF